MRANDLHMVAAIDEQNRMVMITGGIDVNDTTIVMRTELPSAGTWTIMKAETNLTDKTWYGWQVMLGSDITVPMAGNKPQLLTSRNFEHARYVPETNTVGFYGGEIRPGEPILKFYTIETRVPRIVMSHNRIIDEADAELMAEGQPLGLGLPKLEIAVPTKKLAIPDVYRISKVG